MGETWTLDGERRSSTAPDDLIQQFHVLHKNGTRVSRRLSNMLLERPREEVQRPIHGMGGCCGVMHRNIGRNLARQPRYIACSLTRTCYSPRLRDTQWSAVPSSFALLSCKRRRGFSRTCAPTTVGGKLERRPHKQVRGSNASKY